jgi:hypothetical protein
MRIREQKFWMAAVLVVSVLLTTCRKDISLPNQDLEKLFGSWNWVQSSGGFAGQTTTPATVGYTKSLEFNKNGIYKSYKNEKQQEKFKFSLTEGTSISSTGTAYLIEYKDLGFFHKKTTSMSQQSVWFGGQDTLFLNDEAFDGFFNVYTRIK